jgi:hypothetical protein
MIVYIGISDGLIKKKYKLDCFLVPLRKQVFLLKLILRRASCRGAFRVLKGMNVHDKRTVPFECLLPNFVFHYINDWYYELI